VEIKFRRPALSCVCSYIERGSGVRLYDWQRGYVDMLVDERTIFVLKPRQVGMSYINLWYVDYLVSNFENVNVCMGYLSKNRATMEQSLIRSRGNGYPDFLCKQNSRVRVDAASRALRHYSRDHTNYLFLDEYMFIQSMPDIRALMTKYDYIFASSTPNGSSTYYKVFKLPNDDYVIDIGGVIYKVYDTDELAQFSNSRLNVNSHTFSLF